MSVSKATAMVLAEVAVGMFFAVGIARSFIGHSAPWFVLLACGLSVIVRAIDVESWAFLDTRRVDLAGRNAPMVSVLEAWRRQ